MKHARLVLLFLLLSCNSFQEERPRQTACIQPDGFDYLDTGSGSICTSENCTKYQAIWKELIQEKNNLSQDFIDTHFEVRRTSINAWRSGNSFRACYRFSMGWAIAFNCDQFIFNIDADNTHYPALDLPRGTDFTKEEVRLAVDNRAFSSEITKMSSTTTLQFSSVDEAIDDLTKFSGVSKLCLDRVSLHRDTGNLTLQASAQDESQVNACVKGSIDLISGEQEVRDEPCAIN